MVSLCTSTSRGKPTPHSTKNLADEQWRLRSGQERERKLSKRELANVLDFVMLKRNRCSCNDCVGIASRLVDEHLAQA